MGKTIDSLNRSRQLSLIVAALIACTSVAGQARQNRPMPAGFLKLGGANIDRSKPVAATDTVGWIFSIGQLIGPLSDKWIGGFVVNEKPKGTFRLQSQSPAWTLANHEGGVTSPIQVFGRWLTVGFRDGVIARVPLPQLHGSDKDTFELKPDWQVGLGDFTTRALVKYDRLVIAQTIGQSLYAINFADGSIKWHYSAGRPDSLPVHSESTPLVAGGIVYSGLASGEIVAIDGSSGSELWRRDPVFSASRFKDIVGELVIVDNHLIFARADGVVAAINLTTPGEKPVWKQKVAGATTAVYRDGRYYVGTEAGDVHAIEVRSGEMLWNSPRQIGVPISQMAVGESYIYTATTMGVVGAIDIGSGRLTWFDHLENGVYSKPLITNGSVYFATGYKNLYGYSI